MASSLEDRHRLAAGCLVALRHLVGLRVPAAFSTLQLTQMLHFATQFLLPMEPALAALASGTPSHVGRCIHHKRTRAMRKKKKTRARCAPAFVDIDTDIDTDACNAFAWLPRLVVGHCSSVPALPQSWCGGWWVSTTP